MGPHRFERGRPDAGYVEQCIEGGEGAVFTAMVNDPLRSRHAELRQLGQFVDACLVDVDGEMAGRGRWRIVVDQAAGQTPLPHVPDRHRGQGDTHGGDDDRLSAARQERRFGRVGLHVQTGAGGIILDRIRDRLSQNRGATGSMSDPEIPMLDSARGPGFRQLVWDGLLADHVAARARDWFFEDLGHECDWTSVGLIPPDARGELDVVARKPGVIAGLPAAAIVAGVADSQLIFRPVAADGDVVRAGDTVATLAGATRSVLTAERTVLNLLGRLSGIATATRRLVDAVVGTPCRVYDTRKTVPGWRLLDKYAVRMGGGWNHRLGLYDAVLIKDNHLAAAVANGMSPADAVRTGRGFVMKTFPPSRSSLMVVEVEIDTIAELEAVLRAVPDIVLLDNMDIAQLTRCVEMRNRLAPQVVLEASGGIRPDTVAAIAATGVDRVSTGWPTHDAPWLDVALDWK